MAMTTTLPGGHRARKPRLASNLGIPVTSLPVMSQPLAQLPGGRVVRGGDARTNRPFCYFGVGIPRGMEIRFLPLQDWIILANFGRGGEFGEWFKEIRSNCFLLEMIYHGNVFKMFRNFYFAEIFKVKRAIVN